MGQNQASQASKDVMDYLDHNNTNLTTPKITMDTDPPGSIPPQYSFRDIEIPASKGSFSSSPPPRTLYFQGKKFNIKDYIWL